MKGKVQLGLVRDNVQQNSFTLPKKKKKTKNTSRLNNFIRDPPKELFGHAWRVVI